MQNQQQAASQQSSAQTNGTAVAAGGAVGQEQGPASKKPRIGPSGAPSGTTMLQPEYQVSRTPEDSSHKAGCLVP